jgi:ribosome recycling factor
MLDGIRVDYYGTPTPIASMATVNVPEPRLIQIKVWERGQSKAVDKAIRESDLNLNPQVDGDIIRIPLPPLTEERRRDLVKKAKKHGERLQDRHPQAAQGRPRHDRRPRRRTATSPRTTATPPPKKCEEIIAGAVKTVDDIVAAKEKDIMTV